MIDSPKVMCSRLRDLFKFLEISGYISAIAQPFVFTLFDSVE